jgi:uncharacterized protein (DUF1697 family)
MLVHVALLRAVNVGGNKPILMTELRKLATDLGFIGARSVLQSGNLVFGCEARPSDELEDLLEAEAAKRFDLRTDFFVRTLTEWGQILANNPFPEEANRAPGHLIVMFLKRAPNKDQMAALQGSIMSSETAIAVGRQAYIVYPCGIGRSRLTQTFAERKLGIRGTSRNWNTVLKLAAAVGQATGTGGPERET